MTVENEISLYQEQIQTIHRNIIKYRCKHRNQMHIKSVYEKLDAMYNEMLDKKREMYRLVNKKCKL